MMRLSDRERDVLSGIVRGLPSKTIAAELGLSLGSVKIYVGRILFKLRARNPDRGGRDGSAGAAVILSLPEVAQRLSLSVRTVRRLCASVHLR